MPARLVASALIASPLRGSSVIVTRPTGSSAAVTRRVRTLGGEPISLPGMALRAIEQVHAARAALRTAARGEVVVFSSPAAVRFAWQLLPAMRFARRVCVAAVGAGTARALRARGVSDVQVPVGTQDSSGLLAELRGVRGRHIAVIGAPGGRDLLAPTLARRGAHVQRIDVYRRVPPRWTRRHLAALEVAAKPWLLLVSSAEALGQLATGLPPGLVLALRDAECIVSSERLAGLAAQHGFRHVHVAVSALTADLLDAAAQALARHRL
jgi:uroporphyrinogen-III synthase